jgi:hypothetical protein
MWIAHPSIRVTGDVEFRPTGAYSFKQTKEKKDEQAQQEHPS